MPIWVQFLLLIQTIFVSAQPVDQAPVSFIDSAVFYSYGQQVTFQVKIQAQEDIEEISLFIQAEGDSTHLVDITPNQLGEVTYQYDLSTNPLRPFTRVHF